MSEDCIPPFYTSPKHKASLYAMLSRGMADTASVIPDAIYDEWAVQLPGPRAPLVISHPDDVRTVLVDKGENFDRSRQLRLLMRRAWGDGLAAATGESWMAQRTAATPAFRPKAVAEAVPAMADAVTRIAARWGGDELLELRAVAGRIVVEIVGDTLLTGLDDIDRDQLAADIPAFVADIGRFGLLDFLPVSDAMLDRLRGMGRTPQEARLRALAARLAAARAQPPDAVQDLPALLRGAGPLADNIMGTFPAAFETTAQGTSWALYLLALYPEWQDALRAAAENDGDDPSPLALQIAQEALRLYPPSVFHVRAAMKPLSLRGMPLVKNQVVMVAVYAMHRHRQLWERPDAFDPTRFAPDASYHRGAFLPFGAGPRVCIAAQFALTEIAVIISTLVKSFRFTPVDPEPVVSLRIAAHSTTGLNVRVSAV
jgi:cytochrome P450